MNAANAGTLCVRDLLFRTVATLRTDIALFDDVDELQWHGSKPGFKKLGARLDAAVSGTRQHGAVGQEAGPRLASICERSGRWTPAQSC